MEAARLLLAPFPDLPSFLLLTAGDRKPDEDLGMRRPHRVAFMAGLFSWQKMKKGMDVGGEERKKTESEGEVRERRKGDGRRGKVRGGKESKDKWGGKGEREKEKGRGRRGG